MTRAERIATRLKYVWKHPDFDKQSKSKEILAEMPDFDNFVKTQNKIRQEISKVRVEIRPCFDTPVLTRVQEKHLFRKMNWFKYRAQQRLKHGKASDAEKYLKQATEVRNVIVMANMRLAANLTHRYNKSRHYEDILSEANLTVNIAAEGFDWRRGFKFSTYLTWAITNNSGRDIGRHNTLDERYGSGTNDFVPNLKISSTSEFESSLDQREMGSVIDQLIKNVPEREQLILRRRFYDDWSLDDCGRELGVTKERIRQLQVRAIQKMQFTAFENGVNI